MFSRIAQWICAQANPSKQAAHAAADFVSKVTKPEELLSKDAADLETLMVETSIAFHITVIISWVLFSHFMLLQPALANYFNNMWFNYSPDYDVYGIDGSLSGTFIRSGLCNTPAHEMHCTDGQNFTKLALKHRGVPIGCGCGQGILGEGLCPMTWYGYTLSDYVSTPPSIAAMLGLSFFPLVGCWVLTLIITRSAKPSLRIGHLHYSSLALFQVSYIVWSFATDCIFPTAHSVLTVLFLGAFLFHWVTTSLICGAKWGFDAWESKLITTIAASSAIIMFIGAIPRIFLTLNESLGTPIFPNLVHGVGAYAFWLAEAVGLSLTFGAYPILVIAVCLFDPKKKELLKLARKKHTS